MKYFDLYLEDISYINESDLPWEELEGKTVLVTGATGLIGSVIIDTLAYRNEKLGQNITIIALSRTKETIEKRFEKYLSKSYFKYINQDVAERISTDCEIHYIIHAASKGDPGSFVKDPVGIMNANYLGMHQVLELAREKKSKKVVFVSSGEVYGSILTISENGIQEKEYGELDILNSRSCYSSAKRAAETLCVSYYEQYGVDVNIARLCHTYGATMLPDENRVIFQFINNVLNGESIILKSEGLQKRSYCYVADSVKALFYILLKGKAGEAYNVSDKNSVTTIRELAILLAEMSTEEVIFKEQNSAEKKGNSKIEHAVLDSGKIENLGFEAKYEIRNGLDRVLKILKEI